MTENGLGSDQHNNGNPISNVEKQDLYDSYDGDQARHSYQYARSTSPNALLRKTLSRTQSGLTTLSRLRSRNQADPTAGPGAEFTHPLAHVKTKEDVLVDFEGKDDPYRPLNWPMRKKMVTTVLYGLTTAGVTFASAVYTAGIDQISAEFHVGTVVASLGLSLILVGFGIG